MRFMTILLIVQGFIVFAQEARCCNFIGRGDLARHVDIDVHAQVLWLAFAPADVKSR